MAVEQTNFGKVLTIKDAYFAANAVENTGAASSQWAAAETVISRSVSVTSSNTAYSFDIGTLTEGRYGFAITKSASTQASVFLLFNNYDVASSTKVIPIEPETLFPVQAGDSTDWKIRIDKLVVQSTDTIDFVLKRLPL